MTHPTSRLVCGLIGASLLLGACTTKKQEIPSLTGPSELSTSLAIAASPDVLAQDGASQSLITVTAHDSNGQLLRNLPLRVEIAVDGAITDFGSLSARNIVTDTTGRAFVTYTAPPTPPIFVDAGSVVQIRVLPAGTNFGNETTRFATIRLVPPGVIGAPPSPFRPQIVGPASANQGDTVVFSANVADAAGADVTNQVPSYAWNFGDGDTALGRNVTHVYDAPGSVSVSLRITDALGRSATTTQTVNVQAALINTPVILASPSAPNIGQTVSFNASTSVPPTGHTITSYSWDFGDGSGGSGATTSHAYSAAGTYTTILTVTFSNGGRATNTRDIKVEGGLSASFTFSPSSPQAGQQVSFDASSSRAATGHSIQSYSWNFDDGTTGSGVQTSHAYSASGTYKVTVAVTDDQGQTTTTLPKDVIVGLGNPTPSFTFVQSTPASGGGAVTFDGTQSSAAPGRTLTKFTWSFGDGFSFNGPPASAATVLHIYPGLPGTYTVVLTVTDDLGRTGSTSKDITVK